MEGTLLNFEPITLIDIIAFYFAGVVVVLFWDLFFCFEKNDKLTVADILTGVFWSAFSWFFVAYKVVALVWKEFFQKAWKKEKDAILDKIVIKRN